MVNWVSDDFDCFDGGQSFKVKLEKKMMHADHDNTAQNEVICQCSWSWVNMYNWSLIHCKSSSLYQYNVKLSWPMRPYTATSENHP